MRHLRSRSKMVAGLAAASILLSACAGDGEDTTTDTATDTTTDTTTDVETDGEMTDGEMAEESAGDPFALFKAAVQVVGPAGTAGALAAGLDQALELDGDVNSPAAQLRATLTTLLQEHVYLAGTAVDAAFSFGPESAEFGLAAAALDENSVELADVIGSVAPDQRDAFLGLWREHIGFFVEYALGAAGGDDAMKQSALDKLDGYREQAGAFFEAVTGGELPAAAVAENLVGHIETLSGAIDAAAAGDTTVWAELKKAADHMDGTALAISTAVVAAAGLEGDTESAASATLSKVSQLLEEHVFLAGFAVRSAYGAGGDLEAPIFQAAAGVLDENSVELADVIGSVAPDQRDAFLALWREHIGFFVDYAVGVATDDEAKQQGALDALDAYGDQSGAFFEGISGGVITTDAVKGSLQKHIDTLTATIKAFAAAILG